MDQYTLNLLTRACNNDNATEVVELLNEYSIEDNISAINRLFRRSCLLNRIEVVKVMLKDERIDPSDNDNSALLYADDLNNTDIVNLLLEDKRVFDKILSSVKTLKFSTFLKDKIVKKLNLKSIDELNSLVCIL